jgi:3'(2'), 5'-bisphosphate nucleotidase
MHPYIPYLVDVCWQAADAIMTHYNDDFDYTQKEDGSPLTKADLASHEIIVKALLELTPSIQIISEESSEIINSQELQQQFWLVDPLDGTKEFIKRNGEFTIDIALIKNKVPLLGLVCCPALDELFVGHVGSGCYMQKRNGKPVSLKTKPERPKEYTVIGSRSHSNEEAMNNFLMNKNIKEVISAGSSLKFCRIAEGKAHLYPRFGRTMEWDTAAGHAVLAAAGGWVRELNSNQPLQYGKPGLENPHFLASGDQEN